MVRCVATHENERVRITSHAGETADVADRVAGSVEEVEGTVGEIVYCFEVADFHVSGATGGEVELDEVATGVILFHDRTVRFGGIARKKIGFEAWSYNEICRGWELTGRALVIPMPVAPDDCFDGRVSAGNVVRFEDLPNRVLNIDLVAGSFETVCEEGREVLVVLANAEVEEKTASSVISGRLVLDEEGVCRCAEVGVAFDGRLHESLRIG